MYISQSHVYCILVTNIPLSYSTTLHQAEQERKAAVIRAEGEAEAAKLISQAMSTAGTVCRHSLYFVIAYAINIYIYVYIYHCRYGVHRSTTY